MPPSPSPVAGPARIAVVGAGPWGVYAAERLLARAARDGVDVEVTLLDPGAPGRGPNFGADLPDYALLNFPASHVEPWEGVEARSLPSRFRSLVTWLADGAAPAEGAPDPHRAVPRRLVGAYFEAALEALVGEPVPGSSVRVLAERAIDVEPTRRGWRIVLEGGGTLEAGHVLLATGVPFEAPRGEESKALAEAAEAHGLVYVDRWQGRVPYGEVRGDEGVAVMGMGITFVDALLALTEGRGGSFVAAGPGSPDLRYLPSGREPRPLLPFSRSGRLHAPKSRGPWPFRDGSREDPGRAARWRALGDRRGRLDFDEDVWPLVLDEMAPHLRRFDPALARARPGPAELARRLAALPGDPGDDPGGRLLARLRADIRAAEAGAPDSPWRAAVEVWSRLYPRVADLVSIGGLEAASHRRLVEEVLEPWDRLAFGPPLANARKVEALLSGGHVDLRHARGGSVEPDPDAGAFVVRSGAGESRVRQLVEARTPRFHLEEGPPPLHRRLRDRGLLRPFVNRSGGTFATGAAEVDEAGIAARTPSGATLAVVGAPTEGCVIGTDALPSTRAPWVERWARTVSGAVAGR